MSSEISNPTHPPRENVTQRPQVKTFWLGNINTQKVTIFGTLLLQKLMNVYVAKRFTHFFDAFVAKTIWKVVRPSGKFLDHLETFKIIRNISRPTRKFQDHLDSFRNIWKVFRLSCHKFNLFLLLSYNAGRILRNRQTAADIALVSKMRLVRTKQARKLCQYKTGKKLLNKML